MNILDVFLFGLLGGVIPEIYALYHLRHTWDSKKPNWVTSPFYWIITCIMVLLGGGTAALYAKIGINLNELMSIHLGIATPVLIQSYIKSKPKID